jgi:hypothetical protein
LKQKLILLNIVLLAVSGLFGAELYQSWKSARERERQMLNKRVAPGPVVAVVVGPTPAALTAAAYIEVAQQVLFFKTRTPDVEIVVTPTPTPTPVPPFPRFYGVMNLGDGPMAILAEGPARQKPFMLGEKVGQFKLASIGNEDLTFEWQDKTFKKKFSELQEKNEVAQAGGASERTAGPTANAQAPKPTPPPVDGQPGLDTGGGVRACAPNDSAAAGTVKDGYKKVVNDTPFGKACRWEQVGK